MILSSIAPNQVVITTSAGSTAEGNFATIKVLFSYDTPVAARINGVFYKTSEKWSNTTSRHVNTWIDGNAKIMPQSFFDNLLAVSVDPNNLP